MNVTEFPVNQTTESSRATDAEYHAGVSLLVTPGESPGELAALAERYRDEWSPAGPMEKYQLRRLIEAHWNGGREARAEARYIRRNVNPKLDPDYAVLAVYEEPRHSKALARFFRRRQATHREWNQSLEQLRRLQAERGSVPAPPRPSLHA